MRTSILTNRRPSFGIVGDSNSGRLVGVADARRLRFLGGPIGSGYKLDDEFFHVDKRRFVLNNPPQKSPRVNKLVPRLFTAGIPILSTVGSNTQRITTALYRDYYKVERRDPSALSDAVLRQVHLDYRPGPFAFYRAALENGCDIYAVHSPHRFRSHLHPLGLRLELAYLGLLAEIGVPLVDVRSETTDELGRLLPEFLPERDDDLTHGNAAWANLVLDRFLEMSGAPERTWRFRPPKGYRPLDLGPVAAAG